MRQAFYRIDTTLDRLADVAGPEEALRDGHLRETCAGSAYLALAIDLYPRRVIGWAL